VVEAAVAVGAAVSAGVALGSTWVGSAVGGSGDGLGTAVGVGVALACGAHAARISPRKAPARMAVFKVDRFSKLCISFSFGSVFTLVD
jgi:hypothetical protein